MAEISYPFAANSAGGGAQLVSQVQWQAMSHMFSEDCIDYPLTATSYESSDLPFYLTNPGTGTITVHPGNAFVGGFYYQLTANKTLTLAANSGNTDRIDLIVIRADLSSGSVNLAVSQGQPATNPVEPKPKRVPGGIWEMVLQTATVPANGGTITTSDRRKFVRPGPVAVPWNASVIAPGLPPGAFVIDMDNNGTGGQAEGFYGADGFMSARTLGKRLPYTPDLFTVSNKPGAGDRNGFWRWIAPGTISFSVEITTGSKAVTASSGVTIIGFTLPKPAANNTRQVFTGMIDNPRVSNSMPNLIGVFGKTGTGANQNCYMYMDSTTTIKQGLDSVNTIPAYSTLSISGTYETASLY
ncbi:hypothetical protein [Streptomyces sp. NBC_01500]|uniref:hypothetical protein n=1 Tax=Streptomyces sp. NBC_01500 TaxID=2903886 RepID=UPI00224D5DD1|nr:hypothetical protein [Streptomyces sp. NBC_01500]MCX4554141.1 hypothetical protein [Streptomyces sp. NBC_01500]